MTKHSAACESNSQLESRAWPVAVRPSQAGLLGLLAMGLAVRLLGIAARPLWYDEAFAVLFSGRGPAAMLYGTLAPAGGAAADVHPITYYTLLWGWMRLFGQSPVAVRLLSVLTGLGTLALAFGLARALFGERAAFWAALPAALSPFVVHYSQEVRMYALLALWLVGATWALWRGMQAGRLRDWALFAGLAALAQYTHNLAAFYLAALALTPLLARRWRAARDTALAGMAALLVYLPWLARLPGQLSKVQSGYWTERPSPARLVTALLTYVTNLPLPDVWLVFGLFAALLLTALAAYQTLRAVRQRLPGAERGLWLAWLAFAPLLLLYGVSQVVPVFIERALLPSGIMFALWLGWALVIVPQPRPVRTLALALLLAASWAGLYQHLTYSGFPYGPFAALDSSLRERAAPGDAIVHSNKLSMLPAVYYDRGLPMEYVADPPGSGSDTLALPTQQVLGLPAQPDIEQAVGGAPRVWFVIFERAIEEYQAQGEATHPHLAWLDAHYPIKDVEEWGEMRLYVYQR